MINTTVAAKPACSVMVVDDDPEIRDLVADILDFGGFGVHVAANGQEALDLLGRQTVGVILLDMRMPVLDGWGFAKALRARGLTPQVIVMTAAQDSNAWAQEIGAASCLPKPFETEHLLSEVRRACRAA